MSKDLVGPFSQALCGRLMVLSDYRGCWSAWKNPSISTTLKIWSCWRPSWTSPQTQQVSSSHRTEPFPSPMWRCFIPKLHFNLAWKTWAQGMLWGSEWCLSWRCIWMVIDSNYKNLWSRWEGCADCLVAQEKYPSSWRHISKWARACQIDAWETSCIRCWKVFTPNAFFVTVLCRVGVIIRSKFWLGLSAWLVSQTIWTSKKVFYYMIFKNTFLNMSDIHIYVVHIIHEEKTFILLNFKVKSISMKKLIFSFQEAVF